MIDNGSHIALRDSLETIGAACAIFAFDGRWTLSQANARFAAIAGRPLSECLAKEIGGFLPGSVEAPLVAALSQCVGASQALETELMIERDGTARWWRVVAAPVHGVDALARCALVTLIDISDRKQLEAQLATSRQRFEALVQTAYDGIITIDEQQNIRLMNDTARTLFGVGTASVEGSKLSRFMPPRHRDSHQMFVSAFRGASIDARPMHARSPVLGLKADGTEFPIEVTISKIRVDNAVEMTAVIRDVSERSKLLENLRVASSHDALTGLFNRRHGGEVLAREAQRCGRFDHVFSVALLDLDDFRGVNDRLGHYGGDLVLAAVSKLVLGSVREIDTVCRWGGEELLVLLPETSQDEAFRWAERVRVLIAGHDFVTPGFGALQLTVSLGIAMVRKDQTIDQIIDRADKALRTAKLRGRNRVAVGDS